MYRNPWKTNASRIVYQNPWVRVREDEVIRPDGAPGIYGVIEIRPSVGVVAIDDQDRVALVGQWRYSLNRYSWEIPRGGSDPGEEDMLSVARRELAEEAGLRAADWKFLGTVDNCNGVASDTQFLYVATGLSSTEMNHDPEEDITLAWKPFNEVVQMAMQGGITEVCSIAAILKVAVLRGESVHAQVKIKE
jgi:8-oxo-dGTP pyrophosphatase MutT (NUDIX family)